MQVLTINCWERGGRGAKDGVLE